MSRKTFISHRHSDANIATVIRDHLQLWGLGEKEIFQSSVSTSGPKIGELLTKELSDALATTKLVILVYTFADEDWSYCMYECGLATVPGTDQKKTRVVVFQCSPDKPKVLENQVLVRINEQDIQKFVTQTHREADFWPGEPPLRPDITDQAVSTFSKGFFDAIAPNVPEGRLVQRQRWDCFTLHLPKEQATSLSEMSLDENEDKVHEVLSNACTVRSWFGEPARHFGYDAFRDDMPLKDLITRWQKTTEHLGCSDSWIDALIAELGHAIQGIPATPTFDLLRSARTGTDWWFNAVVNHVRILPDGDFEFDVYMYRIPNEQVTKPVHLR